LSPVAGDYDYIAMVLESLLLSGDSQVIEVLEPALQALKIDVDIRQDEHAGAEAICSARYDAVIVDCEGLSGGLDLLERLRDGESNKSSVAFALLDPLAPSNQAFESGANFILRKPVSSEEASGCFRAVLGLMERERRRYFRHGVEMSVTLALKDGAELKAKATNVSETGMAIWLAGSLSGRELSGISFRLPGTRFSIEPTAELAWADGSGQAGVRFCDMHPRSREQLDHWLFEESEKLDRA
jgi:DNA-binding response OmpR family regulator